MPTHKHGSNNRVGDAGAVALAAGVAPLTALQRLYLGYAARPSRGVGGGGVWKGSEEDAAVRKGHAEGAKCIAVWYGYRSVSEQCGKRRLSRLVFTILDTMRDDAARGTGPYASALTDAGQPHTRARAHTHTQYSARKNDAKVLI